MNHKEDILASFSKLLDVMNELREKCPWDRKQTFSSLRNNTIEEVYELSDAILEKDMEAIKKELGDVLLHIVFYSRMASESGDFDIKDVCDVLVDKLIYRHPHIYGNIEANTSDEVKRNWEELKLKEKGRKKGLLSGVPSSLPSMVKAYRIQEKAASVGFDWEDKSQVWDKVQEEIREFQEEVNNKDKDKMTKELGDVFFALVNMARLYGLNPDEALERTNKKFINRFNYLEEEINKQGKHLSEMTLQEMDVFWDESKKYYK